jgi:hypothetical protein
MWRSISYNLEVMVKAAREDEEPAKPLKEC